MRSVSRILAVAGTRPEAIKIAPLFKASQEYEDIELGLLATAQHREMLDQVFQVFDLRPDIDLNLMRPNQSLSELTSAVVTGVDQAICDWKPDIVLVQGDTTTCLGSALAAFYRHVRIGHIEAGLRTYNFAAPWPEEMNRRLVDPISDWCFAPTQAAAENLRSEAIDESRIFVTGNTVIDSILSVRAKVRADPPHIDALEPYRIGDKRIILVTGHRRESFGEPLKEVCSALLEIASSYNDVIIIYPVHLNPNVTSPVQEILGNHDRIALLQPLHYLEFVHLMDRCYFIVSDSGGIQEEAPSFGKPVLVTRTITERTEAVDAGVAKLVGCNRDKLLEAACDLLNDKQKYLSMVTNENPFGDGRASQRILSLLRA